jgi:hypothetical protein
MAASALAQTERNFDPIPTPPDGQPRRIERVEDIPRQLMRAIRDCRLDEGLLRDIPIAVFRPSGNGRIIAIVPCGGIVGHSLAFLFNRWPSEPDVLALPVVDPAGGFTTSKAPGLMTWDPATKILTAQAGNDIGCSSVLRHTYRYSRGDAPFTLIRVERGTILCGDPGWKVIWEAQPWMGAQQRP